MSRRKPRPSEKLDEEPFSEQERLAMCEERFEVWWGKQRPSWAGLNAWDRVTMWENCRAAWYAAWADSDVDQLFRTYRQKKSREPFGPGKPAT